MPAAHAPRRVPDDVRVQLRRARDHIDRHFAEPIDLGGLAALAGLSTFHVLRLFRFVHGVTPAAYLRECRIERAQDLLRATNLTVTEVCHAVGHTSLGSFSAGFTPSKPLSDDLIAAMRRAQDDGGLPGIGLNVDDCRRTCEGLKAKGVEFIQEPTERPYGVEALMRDNSGNWMVLVEERDFQPEDLAGLDLDQPRGAPPLDRGGLRAW